MATDLADLPYELQVRILARLDQKDHVAIHRTSKRWRNLITRYLNDEGSIKLKDWRWYCRHNPGIPSCSSCLDKVRARKDNRNLGKDWKWWL